MADKTDALFKAIQALKSIDWEDTDLDYFFTRAEIKMQSHGVGKQFTKMQAITECLPKKVCDQIRGLLKKKSRSSQKIMPTSS